MRAATTKPSAATAVAAATAAAVAALLTAAASLPVPAVVASRFRDGSFELRVYPHARLHGRPLYLQPKLPKRPLR